jgi:hypothetical protein
LRTFLCLTQLSTLEAETDLADGTPHQKIPGDVATVGFEPGVEGAWVVALADAGEAHGDGGHGATGLADGVGAGAQLFVAPARVALLVKGVSAGPDDGDQEDGEECFHTRKDFL